MTVHIVFKKNILSSYSYNESKLFRSKLLSSKTKIALYFLLKTHSNVWVRNMVHH